MSHKITELNSSEIELLFDILGKMSGATDVDSLRLCIGDDLLRLFRADVLASYIWDNGASAFGSYIGINHDPSNVTKYLDYYQFNDPVTFRIRERRTATISTQVISQQRLEKTEYYNDFMRRDGLHHGLAAHAFDGDLDIGDLRIWRYKNRPLCGKREINLLNFLIPHFRNAIRNTRMLGKLKGMERFLEDILNDSGVGLFLLDENGTIVYQNKNASDWGKSVLGLESPDFCRRVFSEMKKLKLPADSKTLSTNVLNINSTIDGRPYTAVMVNRPNSQELDAESLKSMHGLTSRESEICVLLCKGLKDREIASVLEISFHTVRTHLKHVFEKLDVTTRAELVYMLLQKF